MCSKQTIKDWKHLSLVLCICQCLFLVLEIVRYCQLLLNAYVGVPVTLAYLWLARMNNEWERFCPRFTKAKQCWNISLLKKKTLLRCIWWECCSLGRCQIRYGYEPYRIFLQNKEKGVFSKPNFLYMFILLQNKELMLLCRNSNVLQTQIALHLSQKSISLWNMKKSAVLPDFWRLIVKLFGTSCYLNSVLCWYFLLLPLVQKISSSVKPPL